MHLQRMCQLRNAARTMITMRNRNLKKFCRRKCRLQIRPRMKFSHEGIIDREQDTKTFFVDLAHPTVVLPLLHRQWLQRQTLARNVSHNRVDQRIQIFAEINFAAERKLFLKGSDDFQKRFGCSEEHLERPWPLPIELLLQT